MAAALTGGHGNDRWPTYRSQLTRSLRAPEITLAEEALRRLDEIWPGPGAEARRRTPGESLLPRRRQHQSRELSRRHRVDPYQDRSNRVENRLEDLLTRLTLEDKAGLMFHDIVAEDS